MIVHRYIRQVIVPFVLIGICIFLLMLMQKLSSLSVWDDAYMFVRYADNLLQYGHLSWNPDNIHTYGLTSPAYLLLVVPLRLFFPTEPAVVMLLSSLLSGLLAMLTMFWLLLKLIHDPVHRLVMWVIAIVSLIMGSDSLTVHLTSGMDTMFSLWILAIWIGLLYFSDDFLLIGAVGGLFFVVRPDIVIFPVILISILFASNISHSQLLKYILGGGITLLMLLTITWLYFGHTSPLSFYAKNLTIYSQAFYQHYTTTSLDYFLEFVRTYPYLIAIILFGLLTHFRQWRWQDKGLILGSVVYCIYHISWVIPIMGFSQRFFYPLLPILLILTALNLTVLLSQLPDSFIVRIRNYPLRVLFVPLLLIPALMNPLPIIITLVQYTQPDRMPTVGVGRFDLQAAYDYLYFDNWYRLDELSKLNDDVVIASTEIGLPGVMNPNKHIIDLAGLNQPNFAFNGFSADWLMARENQPDWIYMPFPHYEGMWFSLFDHPVFQTDYDFYYAKSLGTSMDVAIKRDSIFYSDMLDVVSRYE